MIVHGQAGHLPAPNPVDGRTFARIEHILLGHQGLKSMNAKDLNLKDLIQDVLYNPKFNTDDVHHNIHERMMRAVEDGHWITLTCGRKAMASKMSDSLNTGCRWYCWSCWRTNGSISYAKSLGLESGPRVSNDFAVGILIACMLRRWSVLTMIVLSCLVLTHRDRSLCCQY